MAGFMAVGADDGHLSECAIFAIKKTNGTYVWPEARGPRLGLEKQPAVAAQWVARAMFVDARSHVGDPRRGSPCTVGSAGGPDRHPAPPGHEQTPGTDRHTRTARTTAGQQRRDTARRRLRRHLRSNNGTHSSLFWCTHPPSICFLLVTLLYICLLHVTCPAPSHPDTPETARAPAS